MFTDEDREPKSGSPSRRLYKRTLRTPKDSGPQKDLWASELGFGRDPPAKRCKVAKECLRLLGLRLYDIRSLILGL